jgi:tRNA (uracil-5-)-methyltransferase TRM9
LAATEDPDAYERTHVHKVYSQIAPHFSATRHKPWPLIAQFLLAQRPGSVGLDVGCGNGKYLAVNRDVYLIGSDRSEELVRLALTGRDVGGKKPLGEEDGEGRGGEEKGQLKEEKREVMTADGLALPFPDGRADFAICVAVVHHFSTKERRVEAIRALLRCVRPRRGQNDEKAGKVMVFVWALEQKSSRRGWDEGAAQDQLVPWVLKQQQQQQKKKKKGPARTGDDSGKERKEEGEEEKNEVEEVKKEAEEGKTFQRYYHLYRKGELEEDVDAAGGLVLESGYDRDNWWVIAANLTS